MAHFHIPKPLHGWREFAGEVGIIVLGVLIALGAEQIVQSIGTHRDARELRQSMIDELTMDRARWEANSHDVPCTLKQLDEISAWAARSGSDALEGFKPPFFWTMHDSAWQIARSSPTMSALSLKERDALADLYFLIEVQEQIVVSSQQSLNHIDALVKTAERPEGRYALREAAIDTQSKLRAISSNFTPEWFDRLGVRSDIKMLGPNAYNYKGVCPTIAPPLSVGSKP